MPSAARLLLIEDDASLRHSIESALASNGFEVRAEPDGSRLDDAIIAYRPDLAVLDVGLPGDDGFTLAARLRAEVGVPVVFVTAADGLEDRLRGFEVGADDYVVKPFALAELLARVRAVLRRSGRVTSAVHEVLDLIVDEAARTVVRAGVELDVTKTEFELLLALARNPGKVFSKLQLLSLVWGFEQYDPNLVEVHISALRRKLEMYGTRLIHTERSEGYVLGPRRVTDAGSPSVQ